MSMGSKTSLFKIVSTVGDRKSACFLKKKPDLANAIIFVITQVIVGLQVSALALTATNTCSLILNHKNSSFVFISVR